MDWFDDLAQQWQGKRVLVIGDLMLDVRSHYCTVRECNEFDGPILRHDYTRFYPGGAAFTAMNCHALGADVTLLGMVADDPEGDQLLQELATAGVWCPASILFGSRELDADRTTVKMRVCIDGVPRYRIDRDGTCSYDTDLIYEELRDNQDQYAALLISDYQKGIWNEKLDVNAIINSFRIFNSGAMVTANPKPALVNRMTGKVDLMQLNEAEYESLEREELPAERLLLTRGSRGLMFKSDEHIFHSVIRQPVRNADVAGCGDATFAAATLALTAGAEYPQIAMVARRAGTAKARKSGTLPVSVDDIKKELDELPRD